jgi:peptidoglycan/LPS O-acetylase OafA/YrhL
MTHAFGTFTILGCRSYWNVPFAHQSAGLQLISLIGGIFNPNGAVVLFFVLSGYVLSLSLFRHEQPLKAQIVPYLVRRAFRLFPAMWFSILLIACVRFLWADSVPFVAQSDWFASVFGTPATGIVVVRNFALIDFTANPVTWTIYIEAAGSLLVPLLVLATIKSKPIVGLLILGGLIMLACVSPVGTDASRFLFCFQAGVLLACHPKIASAAGRPGLFFLGGIALMVVQRLMMLNDSKGTLLEALGATAILLATLRPFSAVSFRWLDWGLIRYLGRISYSLYLLHIVAIYALAQLFSGLNLLNRFPATPFLLIVGTVMLTLPLAWLCYAAIELPMIRFGKRVGWIFEGGRLSGQPQFLD